jgi:hypothetical protein
MVSDGMIYIRSLMTIGSGMRVVLRVLLQQFERLYVELVLLMTGMYDVCHGHASGGMTYSYTDKIS